MNSKITLKYLKINNIKIVKKIMVKAVALLTSEVPSLVKEHLLTTSHILSGDHSVHKYFYGFDCFILLGLHRHTWSEKLANFFHMTQSRIKDWPLDEETRTLTASHTAPLEKLELINHMLKCITGIC